MVTQVLFRLPDDVACRLKRLVPARQRSAFVQRLIEAALPAEGSETDPLYLAALDVEQDEGLAREMLAWDIASGDGIAAGHDGKDR
jgi:hypothetical protein